MSEATLVLAAHDQQTLDADTASAVSAALRLNAPVHVLVLGAGPSLPAVAQQAAALAGVDRVLVAAAPWLQQPNAETVSRQIVALAGAYHRIVAAHQMLPRAALPRAAACLGAAFLADVSAIPRTAEVVRPIYAGSANASVALGAQTVLMTVRGSAFAPTGQGPGSEIVSIEAVPADERTARTVEPAGTDARPALGRARVVVAAGRGLRSAEHMPLVEALADRLGGAVGASRAAVDAGFAPNALQIGQTGKSVAPDVYIAVGISGAIQHLAGIKDARTIVAINKDADAPIFSVADEGWVGDLFEALPRLSAELPRLG